MMASLRHQNQITRIADVRKFEKVWGFFLFLPQIWIWWSKSKGETESWEGGACFSPNTRLRAWRGGWGLFYLNSRLSGRACSTRADGPSNIRGGDKKSGQRRMRVCGGEGVMEMEGGFLMGAIRAISFLICLHLHFLVLVTLLALTLDTLWRIWCIHINILGYCCTHVLFQN